MAIAYKRYTQQAVGSSLVQIGSYTVPSSTKANILGLNLSNILTTDVLVTVSVANSTTNTCILKGGVIPANNSLSLIGRDIKTLVLDVGDKVQVQSNTASSIDVYMSLTEHA